jgi:2-(1,2-epoxy-1,2-dihydrophenyl)acetyl-CoA isomerase
MSVLLVEREGGIATLTINRPETRNAINLELRRLLTDTLREIETDKAVRCVILRGAGEHFMSGGDVKSFLEYAEQPPEVRRRTFLQRIHDLHPIMMVMRRMPQPVIGSIRGAVAGAGMSIALNCDLLVAAQDAFFTLAYVHIGASPDGSATSYLPRVVGAKKAMEIALLGDRYDAATALDLGLVNWVVPTEQLEAETRRIAGRIAAGPSRAHAGVKRLLGMSLNNGLAEQLQAEAETFADVATSDDWVEGVRAFNEKRKPRFSGN